MIRLSYSSISDFLVCEKRFFYRITASQESAQNVYMARGSIVHAAIEKHWDDKDEAIEYIKEQSKVMGLSPFHRAKMEEFVETFFLKFAKLCSKDDLIEHWFELVIGKEVYVVGKIDRILPNGTIIDWKTGSSNDSSLANSIQFIIYWESYKKLFGKEPKELLLASLYKGQIKKYVKNERLTKIFYDEIIPGIVKKVKDKNFMPTGLYKDKVCENCPFQKICWRDYELDSKKLTVESVISSL